jgi:hypothetical protein
MHCEREWDSVMRGTVQCIYAYRLGSGCIARSRCGDGLMYVYVYPL